MSQGPKQPWITGDRNWRCPFDDRTMARSDKGSLFFGLRLRQRRVSASSPQLKTDEILSWEDVDLSCSLGHPFEVPWEWIRAAYHAANAGGYLDVRVPRRFAVNAKRS